MVPRTWVLDPQWSRHAGNVESPASRTITKMKRVASDFDATRTAGVLRWWERGVMGG
jgi:hypothetical protein